MRNLTLPSPSPIKWSIYLALGVLFFAGLVLLILSASARTALASDMGYPAIAQAVAPIIVAPPPSFWESPFMLNIYIILLGSICTFALAHATGFVAWVQSKTVSTTHPEAAAIGQRVEGIVANAMVAELKGVATVIASVGPNPTVADINAATAVAKTQAVVIAKSQINAQNLMSDATAVFGTGLDQHIDTLANKTITTTLLSAAKPS